MTVIFNLFCMLFCFNGLVDKLYFDVISIIKLIQLKTYASQIIKHVLYKLSIVSLVLVCVSC